METVKKRRKRRPFPRDSLEEALKISRTIQEQNNGQPMKRIFIADSMKIKPESSSFRDLLSSSIKYGLTKGGAQADYISLLPLGANIIKTQDQKEKIVYLQEACQKVKVFKDFYQRYRDAKLPSDDYAHNLLKDEFNVPEDYVSECFNFILTNGRFSKIIQDVAGSPRVVFEIAPGILTAEEKGEVERGETEKEEIVKEEVEKGKGVMPSPPIISKLKQIFIAHGKNRVPLEQLKTILDQFKVPYKAAIDEPHRGRPISQKVAEVMRSCSSAIFIFTADEEVTDSEGKRTYRPSDNVVYELGAAGILFDKNIVIFKEEGLTFASDFSDLGYITFEKDNLQAKATDLLRELIEFGLLKITPT